jgi:hypothetical protein
MNLKIFVTRGRLAKLFKSVGTPATWQVVTSGHIEKRGKKK